MPETMPVVTSSHSNLTKLQRKWHYLHLSYGGHSTTERLFSQENGRVRIVPSSYDYRAHMHASCDFETVFFMFVSTFAKASQEQGSSWCLSWDLA